jgi:hypothetical protein
MSGGQTEARFPEERLNDLHHHQDLARADLAVTQAIILGHASQWKDALNEWHDATQKYRSLAQNTGERLARTGTAWLLAFRLDQPDTAHGEIARLTPNPSPDGLTRWAKIVAGAVAQAKGDTEGAVEQLHQSHAISSKLSLDLMHAEVVTGLNEIIAAAETELSALLSTQVASAQSLKSS